MRTVLAVLAGLLLLAPGALAQQPRASYNDLEDEVMCVSCNVPLNVADSPQADRTRQEIERLIAQGLTKDEIKDRLVAQYGQNVLAEPDTDGFGIIAYVVPAAAAALLLALLAHLLPRWRRRAAAAPGADETTATAPPLPAADAARLDADMARYER